MEKELEIDITYSDCPFSDFLREIDCFGCLHPERPGGICLSDSYINCELLNEDVIDYIINNNDLY